MAISLFSCDYAQYFFRRRFTKSASARATGQIRFCFFGIDGWIVLFFSPVSDGNDEESSSCEHRPPSRGLVPEHVLGIVHKPGTSRLAVQLPTLHRRVGGPYLRWDGIRSLWVVRKTIFNRSWSSRFMKGHGRKANRPFGNTSRLVICGHSTWSLSFVGGACILPNTVHSRYYWASVQRTYRCNELLFSSWLTAEVLPLHNPPL